MPLNLLRLHLRFNRGAPRVSCLSTTARMIAFSPSLCSLICVRISWPPSSASVPPPAVSFLCHRLLSSLLGPRPSRPAWPSSLALPLRLGAGPTPCPPLGQASDPPVDTEVGRPAQGPWGRGQAAAPQHPQRPRVGPNRGAPGRGHGGGLPHQVRVSARSPRAGVLAQRALPPPTFLARGSAPAPAPPPCRSPLSDTFQPQSDLPRPASLPPAQSPPPFSVCCLVPSLSPIWLCHHSSRLSTD